MGDRGVASISRYDIDGHDRPPGQASGHSIAQSSTVVITVCLISDLTRAIQDLGGGAGEIAGGSRLDLSLQTKELLVVSMTHQPQTMMP